MSTIKNACDTPLNANSGTLPNLSTTLANSFQLMVFEKVQKTIVNGQVIETEDPIDFKGSWAPFTIRMLMMKPEGQRSWKWYQVFSETQLPLSTDEVINRLGQQYRVMQLNDFSLYGFFEYHLIGDYSGSGPGI